MTWSNGKGVCELHKGGTFHCWWENRLWCGTWRMDGDTLHVDEHEAANDEWGGTGRRCKWSAVLEPGRLTGKLNGGGRFELRKSK